MDKAGYDPRHEGEMADMMWKACHRLIPGNDDLEDAMEDTCPGLYKWYKEHKKFLARPVIIVKPMNAETFTKQAVEVLNRSFRKYPYK